MAEIGRLLTAMVTPFDDKGAVDFEQAKKLANALLDSGSDGVVLSGTTGESPTLTTDEKMRLFSEVKQSIGDKGVVIAGTGTYSTAESIELSQEAEKQGVDGLLLVVPYYNKPPQEGIYQHFKAIAGKTNLPCIVYNIIGRTGVNMTDETTIRLSQIAGASSCPVRDHGRQDRPGARWPAGTGHRRKLPRPHRQRLFRRHDFSPGHTGFHDPGRWVHTRPQRYRIRGYCI